MLYVRQGPYESMSGMVGVLRRLFRAKWGPGKAAYNRQTHTWTLPHGATLKMGVLPDGEQGREYYETTYQGQSFSLIVVDEVQQWARLDIPDLLISNLRGDNVQTRIDMAANPGGRGHSAIVQRWINNPVGAWMPFDIVRDVRTPSGVVRTSRRWIYCPSTYLDNPHNGPDYLANLAVSAGNDPELLDAWINGNWHIARGSYFASVLDNVHVRTSWPSGPELKDWNREGWKFWLSYDHGTASPAVAYVVARSNGALGPDGRYYPAGSFVMVDEYACHREGDLTAGRGWTIPQIAGPIKQLAARWGIKPEGFADDAIFGKVGSADAATGEHKTLAKEYALEGVTWKPASKGSRAARFQGMRRMLADAGSVEQPGLYFDRRCRYWWDTVPFIQMDPKDREAPEKGPTDHGLDGSSYGIQDVVTRWGSAPTPTPWG